MTGQAGAGDTTQAVTVRVGEAFAVTLNELPGAGYRWTVPDVPQPLAFVSAEWDEPTPEGVGASRARRFVLRADAPGDYELRLVLRRPWEDMQPGSTLQQHTVRVHVDPAEEQ